jgi:hypothetical protein
LVFAGILANAYLLGGDGAGGACFNSHVRFGHNGSIRLFAAFLQSRTPPFRRLFGDFRLGKTISFSRS